MSNIAYVKSSCRCTSCMFMLYAMKYNEDENGNYDLKVRCQIVGCPPLQQEKEVKRKQEAKEEARRRAKDKIDACIAMLERCIALKTTKRKGRA